MDISIDINLIDEVLSSETTDEISVDIVLDEEQIPAPDICERIDECLDIPETNGTYSLKILNGVKSWIAAATGAVWGNITGTLSNQTDLQNALDGKVESNAPITGATKTKVTYDSKGLVTSGADATTADIADSTNRRYVTDAQLTVIGNTSGTNTGDQDLSGLQTKRIVVSSSITAVIDEAYTQVASATYTDPTPQEGKGYSVLVRNGTATIGGTGYNTVGQLIWRVYHSGAWATYQLTTQTQLNAKQDSLGYMPEDVSNKSNTTTLGTSDTLYPTQKAVKTYVDNATNSVVLVSSATASSSAVIDFTLPSGYKTFELRCISVVPSTDNVGMWVRVSTNGGSTYLSGASDYAYQRSILLGTTYGGTLTTADSKIAIIDAGTGTGTGRYSNTVITVYEPSISSMYKNISAKQYVYRSDSAYNIREINGVYLSNTAVNAIRILMSSGNIASGTFELWGYK